MWTPIRLVIFEPYLSPSHSSAPVSLFSVCAALCQPIFLARLWDDQDDPVTLLELLDDRRQHLRLLSSGTYFDSELAYIITVCPGTMIAELIDRVDRLIDGRPDSLMTRSGATSC
jgi:hypothetical protein